MILLNYWYCWLDWLFLIIFWYHWLTDFNKSYFCETADLIIVLILLILIIYQCTNMLILVFTGWFTCWFWWFSDITHFNESPCGLSTLHVSSVWVVYVDREQINNIDLKTWYFVPNLFVTILERNTEPFQLGTLSCSHPKQVSYGKSPKPVTDIINDLRSVKHSPEWSQFYWVVLQ